MTFSFGRHFCRNRCVFINIVILTFLPSTVVTVVLTDFRLSLSNFSSSLRKLIRFSGRTFRKRKLTGAAVGWDWHFRLRGEGRAGGRGEKKKCQQWTNTLLLSIPLIEFHDHYFSAIFLAQFHLLLIPFTFRVVFLFHPSPIIELIHFTYITAADWPSVEPCSLRVFVFADFSALVHLGNQRNFHLCDA